jgi:hypothetical protein
MKYKHKLIDVETQLEIELILIIHPEIEVGLKITTNWKTPKLDQNR